MLYSMHMAIHFEKTTEEGSLLCTVCGMPISDIGQAFTEEHAGQLLAFDRQECLKDFLEDPERYTLKGPKEP